ncbi:MAG: hypothetical protein ABIS18_08695 [Actinomycetota bacterium]
MTFLLVIMLAVLWGVVFMPSLLRARKGTSPIGSVGTFRRSMSALSSGATSGAGGRWVLVPPSSEDINVPTISLHHRRMIFMALLAASAVSLLLGILPGLHKVLWANLVSDIGLAAFCAYLVRTKPAGAKAKVFQFEREDVPETKIEPVEQLDDEYLKVGGFGI